MLRGGQSWGVLVGGGNAIRTSSTHTVCSWMLHALITHTVHDWCAVICSHGAWWDRTSSVIVESVLHFCNVCGMLGAFICLLLWSVIETTPVWSCGANDRSSTWHWSVLNSEATLPPWCDQWLLLASSCNAHTHSLWTHCLDGHIR